MKLTNQQLTGIQMGLQALDGKMVTVEIGGEAKEIYQGFKFQAGPRWDIAKRLQQVETALKPFIDARQAAVKQHSEGIGNVPIDHPNHGALTAEILDLLALPVEVNLKPLPLSDLQLSVNDIPIAALTQLAPIITE